jgi:transposase-like protein
MTFAELLRLFPDNQACLDYLKDRYYPNGAPCPKCGKPSRFHRIKGRSAFGCQFCGHQVYPTAGTIFHKSTTSLQLWFYAIYLMSSTRCGISAKQLERTIGVSNKTALRMFRQIRSLLSEDPDKPIGGEGMTVEADETFVGGKLRESERRQLRAQGIVNRGPATKYSNRNEGACSLTSNAVGIRRQGERGADGYRTVGCVGWFVGADRAAVAEGGASLPLSRSQAAARPGRVAGDLVRAAHGDRLAASAA